MSSMCGASSMCGVSLTFKKQDSFCEGRVVRRLYIYIYVNNFDFCCIGQGDKLMYIYTHKQDVRERERERGGKLYCEHN